MKKETRLQVLDCSLRDGGYYTHWDFPTPFVKDYVKQMERLPVDLLEIGYRSPPKPGYLGTFFYTPPHILKFLSEQSGKELAIMLNAKDIDPSGLETLLVPCKGIISLIRIAVAPDKLSRISEVIDKIKGMGFRVAVNVMYLSTWIGDFSMLKNLKTLGGKVDYLNLVDSYGGVLPSQVAEIFSRLKEETDTVLGFHAHNNLELALANTMAAIASGAEIVDSTVLGMGRGAGNLKTELLLTALDTQGRVEVNYDELSKAVGLFTSLHEKYRWGTNLAYMVSGANSLPQQEVMDQISKRFYSLNSIVRGVQNKSKGMADNLRLKPFNPDKTFPTAVIIGGGPSASVHAEAILNFLDALPEVCIIHASSRNAAAFKSLEGVQYHCLVGNEGHRLESVYKDLENSSKTAVLPPFPRSMGTYIPPALEGASFELKGGDFTVNNPESVTAIAIETALAVKAETIYFAGYDGYDEQISPAELELFQENEALFARLSELGKSISAITPTKYSRLKQESVYSYL